MKSLWRRLLALTLAGTAALAVLSLGLLASGRAAYVVTHGVSMKPVYHQGDLVIVEKASGYHPGQIVAYRAAGGHVVVLHRIVGGNAAGFVMKGDNNQSIDPTRPTADQVLGKAVVHLPQAGLWLHRITSPALLAGVAFALVAAGGTAENTRRRRRRNRRLQRRSSMSRPVASWPTFAGLTTPAWRTAVGATAFVGLLGGILAGVGWSGSEQRAATVASTTSRAVSFSYRATVPQSAAYDGTSVNFPQPVFRRLTNQVDIHYAYRGTPSSVTLAAKLQTASGWNVTVPLQAAAGASGGDVTLDLNALEARAKAAAEVTGIPQSQVATSVVATVHTASAPDFDASLAFILTPLQLTPVAGNGAALTVKDTTSVRHNATVEREVSLLGHAFSVRSIRLLAMVLLLLAIGGAALLLLLGRCRPVTSEAERIRRRYSRLLLPVEPLVKAPGHRIIDVTDFTTLVRLAERYGLLVLHWNRSNIETFVVQDDSVTYRYRVGADGVWAGIDEANDPMTSRPNAERVAGTAKSVNHT